MLARQNAKTKRPPKKKRAKIDGGSIIVCALCGKIIKSPAGGGTDDAAIYSICAACKRRPPRMV